MMGGWSEGGEWGLYVRKQMVQRVDGRPRVRARATIGTSLYVLFR